MHVSLIPNHVNPQVNLKYHLGKYKELEDLNDFLVAGHLTKKGDNFTLYVESLSIPYEGISDNRSHLITSGKISQVVQRSDKLLSFSLSRYMKGASIKQDGSVGNYLFIDCRVLRPELMQYVLNYGEGSTAEVSGSFNIEVSEYGIKPKLLVEQFHIQQFAEDNSTKTKTPKKSFAAPAAKGYPF